MTAKQFFQFAAHRFEPITLTTGDVVCDRCGKVESAGNHLSKEEQR